MDTLYSFGLLAAIIFSCLGAASAAVLTISRQTRERRVTTTRLAALIFGLIALVAGAGSAAVHLVSGHGPESIAPMNFIQFIVQHKAYWIVLALCALTIFGSLPFVQRIVRRSAPSSDTELNV